MSDTKKSSSQTPSGVKNTSGEPVKSGEGVQLGTPPSAAEKSTHGGGVPGEARGPVGDPTSKQAPESGKGVQPVPEMQVPEQYKAMGGHYHTAMGLAQSLGGANWKGLLKIVLAVLSAWQESQKDGGIVPSNPPTQP